MRLPVDRPWRGTSVCRDWVGRWTIIVEPPGGWINRKDERRFETKLKRAVAKLAKAL